MAFIIIKFCASHRNITFAEEREVLLNGTNHFPENSEDDFTGFVDTLRVGDRSTIVGFRYFCFEEFANFAHHLMKRSGIECGERHVDIYLTDNPSCQSALPFGEQVLGGIHFSLDSNDHITVSLDLSFLDEKSLAQLKDDVSNCYSVLGTKSA